MLGERCTPKTVYPSLQGQAADEEYPLDRWPGSLIFMWTMLWALGLVAAGAGAIALGWFKVYVKLQVDHYLVTSDQLHFPQNTNILYPLFRFACWVSFGAVLFVIGLLQLILLYFPGGPHG